MPISEVAPTTTSLQTHAASPLPPAGSVTDEKTQEPTPEQSPDATSVDKWEEPHPGQRFSLPQAKNSGAGGCDHRHPQQHATMGAQNKIGMAAKGYTPYPSRVKSLGFGTRRFPRPRLRPTSLRVLRLPAINRHDLSPAPLSRALRSTLGSSAPALKRSASMEFTPTTTEVDSTFDGATDTDGFSRPISCAIETVASSELSSPRLSMTDFSNHLNISFETGEFDVVGNKPGLGSQECLSVVGTHGDPYGWESELHRKLTCSEMEYRRTGGGKRSLLHRVFSIGPKGVS